MASIFFHCATSFLRVPAWTYQTPRTCDACRAQVFKRHGSGADIVTTPDSLFWGPLSCGQAVIFPQHSLGLFDRRIKSARHLSQPRLQPLRAPLWQYKNWRLKATIQHPKRLLTSQRHFIYPVMIVLCIFWLTRIQFFLLFLQKVKGMAYLRGMLEPLS